jgi:hypothetical protein
MFRSQGLARSGLALKTFDYSSLVWPRDTALAEAIHMTTLSLSHKGVGESIRQ